MVIQTFVSLRLDYCNTLFLFSDISDRLTRRLQAVQNAAARLVTGTRRRDHISPVLRQLHWLSVHQRIKFKLFTSCLQVVIWPSSPILGWRLWTRCSCRPSSVTIVGHCYVRCSTNQHSSLRSGIRSCWTTVVEQPSVQRTTVRPYPSSVPPGVTDVFVWLTGTPAPSDFCF